MDKFVQIVFPVAVSLLIAGSLTLLVILVGCRGADPSSLCDVAAVYWFPLLFAVSLVGVILATRFGPLRNWPGRKAKAVIVLIVVGFPLVLILLANT